MPLFIVTMEREVTDCCRYFVEVEAPTSVAAEHLAIQQVLDCDVDWQYHRQINSGTPYVASVEKA